MMPEILSGHALLFLGVLAAGLAAGFAGGLFGIGGGVITVPVLYSVFALLGVQAGTALKTAIGTSLAVIIVTSVRSLAAHRGSGKVDAALLRVWSPWIALGAGAGGLGARWVPAELLAIVFAGGAIYIAWRRLTGRGTIAPARERNLATSPMRIPLGFGTGLFSSLMGLGGGAMGVMVMTAAGRSMHEAVATASGFGVAVAAPGAAGFLLAGLAVHEGLPTGSIGYINLPAFIVMAIMAALAAPFGARLAHRVRGIILSRLFGAYVGLAAIGLLWEVFTGR
jgi:uncharacterized membrane protein YfcA